jgi:hypothetical protein
MAASSFTSTPKMDALAKMRAATARVAEDGETHTVAQKAEEAVFSVLAKVCRQPSVAGNGCAGSQRGRLAHWP